MIQTFTFIQSSLGEIVNKEKYDSWCINEITAEYVHSMRMKIQNEGKESACKHYKGLNLIARCLATNTSLPVIPFCKTTKDGVPRELNRVKLLLLSGDADLQRFGLTITRNFEQIFTKPVWNPNPITDQGPKLSEQLKLEFNNFCYNWTGRVGIRNRNLQSSTTVRSGIVKGPNGPAIITAHQDAGAVLDDIELSTNLKKLATLTGNEWIWDMLQFLGQPEQNKGFKSGRISLLQEGGGKTRTIAIADYWSQNLLRPIHKDLMDILKRLETDGTFSHGDQFKRILLKSMGSITYCHDLSSATDRFPVELQEILLSHVFNRELADCWRKVLTSRSFSYNNNTHVKWETGQPLGLLSSWAAFALTHHAIIEFCAFKKGFKSFRKYAVLGDDVAIWDEDVAKQYEQLLTEIGVPINYDKSLVSDTRTHRLEFAKRIAVNGVEISGLKPAILKESDTLSGYLDLIRTARDRSWNLHWADVLGPSSWSVNRKNLLSILVWEASNGTCAPKGVNLKGNTELSEDCIFDKLKGEILLVRRNSILKKVEQLDKLLSGKPVEELFRKEGITVSERSIGLLGMTTFYHPVVWEINRVGESLNKVLIKLWEEPEPDDLPPLSDVEYLPIPNLSVFFGQRHLLRSKAYSSLVLRAWSSLNNHEVN